METRVCATQPTERQMTKDEVPTIEDFTVKQTKDEYCRDDMTQLGMSGSEFYIDHKGFLF